MTLSRFLLIHLKSKRRKQFISVTRSNGSFQCLNRGLKAITAMQTHQTSHVSTHRCRRISSGIRNLRCLRWTQSAKIFSIYPTSWVTTENLCQNSKLIMKFALKNLCVSGDSKTSVSQRSERKVILSSTLCQNYWSTSSFGSSPV